MTSSNFCVGQLKWILLFAVASFLWKSFTQRAPFFLLPKIPALPQPHSCAVYHADVVQFCEELTELPNSPKIILSCDPARRQYNHIKGHYSANLPRGQLWIFDPTNPEDPPTLIRNIPEDFRPLGIASAHLSDTLVRLFVANAAKSGPRVEVLDLDVSDGTSIHTNTLIHPLITSPNAIATLNAETFYLTNDVWASRKHPLFTAGELLSGLPGGTLIFATLDNSNNGLNATYVTRLAFANGVAVDTKTNRLWVASTLKGVYAHTFDPKDPARLQFGGSFHRTVFLPDNLRFAHGELYVTGVGSVRALANNAKNDRAKPPPSIAAQLVPGLERGADRLSIAIRGRDLCNTGLRREEWRWKTLFYDDGALFGSMTGVSVTGKGMLIGSGIVMKGVLVCKQVPDVRPLKPKEDEIKDEL